MTAPQRTDSRRVAVGQRVDGDERETVTLTLDREKVEETLNGKQAIYLGKYLRTELQESLVIARGRCHVTDEAVQIAEGEK